MEPLQQNNTNHEIDKEALQMINQQINLLTSYKAQEENEQEYLIKR